MVYPTFSRLLLLKSQENIKKLYNQNGKLYCDILEILLKIIRHASIRSQFIFKNFLIKEDIELVVWNFYKLKRNYNEVVVVVKEFFEKENK